MEDRTFYAKSKGMRGEQLTVSRHLTAVSVLAGGYGAAFACESAAEIAGLLHDFGKYSDWFQDVLTGKRTNVDHAVCGAAMLFCLLQKIPPAKRPAVQRLYQPVIEAINGHHDGLVEFELLEPVLKESLRSDCPIQANDRKQAALAGMRQYMAAWRQFTADFPQFRLSLRSAMCPGNATNLVTMLCTRMLFSCLVDADYSSSAQEEDPDYLSKTTLDHFDAKQVLQRLYEYRENLRQNSDSDAGVNRLRDEVFERCGVMGEQLGGLFTLTTPTGTGKTLALFHFALRHCLFTGKRRIIIVLPFLTLTEQNADVYRRIFPELLEDHSQSDLDDADRAFAARWSVPVIVTTSVRFFESLFARRPTDCRKLHHIADSVVVFDEAQSLPPELTSATLQAVNELCGRYHCTMLFSTATQPDFDALKTVSWQPKEVIPDHARLYQALARTRVDWRLDRPVPLEELAAQMAEQKSACTIVNLRKHARALYQILKERCAAQEMFFLTTDLCPAHRRALVAEINRRLHARLPCRVVATQCIEAGVDFDFDCIFRALAPLEAIIQAAGRCNRNGRLAGGGQVIVFVPEEAEPLYPGRWYEDAARKVEYINHHHPIDIHNPAHIKEYYQLLFRNAKDKEALAKAIRDRSFEDVDRAYQLIPDQGVRVIVPWPGKEAEYQSIRAQALAQGITPELMRCAAGITVTVSNSQRERLTDLAEPLFFAKRGRKSDRESGFYVLRPQFEDCYTEDMGLQLPEEAAMLPFV